MHKALLIIYLLIISGCSSSGKPVKLNDKNCHYSADELRNAYPSNSPAPRNIITTVFLYSSPTAKANGMWTSEELNEIGNGLRLYNSGDAAGGAKILSKYHQRRPQDLYVYADYAKAVYGSYKNDSKERVRKTLPLYRDLLEKVDRETRSQDKILSEPNQYLINKFFVDAYWKAGTLYLDDMNYAAAKKEIERGMIGYISSTASDRYNKYLLEQMYLFLTETSYFLNERNDNNFYYCKTLSVNPENVNVKKYLLK